MSDLVSQINIAPTLLDATKTPIPATMQEKSFLPLVDRRAGRNPSLDWRSEVYIGMREFTTGRILRTPEWTYAVSAPKRPGWKAVERSDRYVEYMLYDVKADPFQHTNLAGYEQTKACGSV